MFDRLFAYAKAAFMQQWHLLAFGSAVAFALLLPLKGATFPLIFAMEVLYMAAMCTNPRFQKIVDSGIIGSEQEKKQQEARAKFERLYNGLDGKSQEQFRELRSQCEAISDFTASGSGMDSFATAQAQSVNKLLWVYLKLLHTKKTLGSFLKNVDVKTFDDLKKKTLARMSEIADLQAKASLQDTLDTIKAREDNLGKAKQNFEHVDLELERIHAKLMVLAEMAINRQDLSTITSGVDAAARSVETTERTISDLNSFTGLGMEDETAPDIIVQSVKVGENA